MQGIASKTWLSIEISGLNTLYGHLQLTWNIRPVCATTMLVTQSEAFLHVRIFY